MTTENEALAARAYDAGYGLELTRDAMIAAFVVLLDELRPPAPVMCAEVTAAIQRERERFAAQRDKAEAERDAALADLLTACEACGQQQQRNGLNSDGTCFDVLACRDRLRAQLAALASPAKVTP